MGYGPDEKYPYMTECGSCDRSIWVQWSGKSQKEYATDNQKWEQGTQGAKFHSCFNWQPKTEQKAVATKKASARFDAVNETDRILAKIYDILIRIANGIEKLP